MSFGAVAAIHPTPLTNDLCECKSVTSLAFYFLSKLQPNNFSLISTLVPLKGSYLDFFVIIFIVGELGLGLCSC